MKKLFLLALICLPLMFSCTSEELTTTNEEVQVEQLTPVKDVKVLEQIANARMSPDVMLLCASQSSSLAQGAHVLLISGTYYLETANPNGGYNYQAFSSEAAANQWCYESAHVWFP